MGKMRLDQTNLPISRISALNTSIPQKTILATTSANHPGDGITLRLTLHHARVTYQRGRHAPLGVISLPPKHPHQSEFEVPAERAYSCVNCFQHGTEGQPHIIPVVYTLTWWHQARNASSALTCAHDMLGDSERCSLETKPPGAQPRNFYITHARATSNACHASLTSTQVLKHCHRAATQPTSIISMRRKATANEKLTPQVPNSASMRNTTDLVNGRLSPSRSRKTEKRRAKCYAQCDSAHRWR